MSEDAIGTCHRPAIVVPAYLRMSEHVRALRHGALESPRPGMADKESASATCSADSDEPEPLAWLRMERSRSCAVLALG